MTTFLKRYGVPTKFGSLHELALQIETLRPSLIAIDGPHGAGKSTVARALATRLGVRCVHLDDFLVPHQGSFVKSLRLPELSAALQERPLLVEGVCLLAVMERLSLEPDMLLYIAGTEPDLRAARGRGPLDDEVRAYHREYRPIDIADAVYTWSDINNGGDFMTSTREDIDIAFIKAKTTLAVLLAIGGMLALVIGLAVMLYGVTGQDFTLVRAANFEMSASGLGGVIMTTSVLWAFFSYKCRPIYSQILQSSEVYGSDGAIRERRQHMSASAAAVAPAQRPAMPNVGPDDIW